MPPVIVYITGFRQHAGKTVTSLGIAMLLSEIMDPARIGYLKPVGQRTIMMADNTHVDEDALVIEKFSGIPDLDIRMISPVRLESGFTKEYLAGDTARETKKLEDTIMRSIESLSKKDIIIAEGTGHPGVGAIVGLSNAHVGNLLGAKIIFLSGGGIGKALDQLEVDLSYFYHMGSDVRGIIFNKLIPDKIPSVKEWVTEDLLSSRFSSKSGRLRILGFFPQINDLANPSMRSLVKTLAISDPLGNPEDQTWKTPCRKIRVVTPYDFYWGSQRLVTSGDLLVVSAGSHNALAEVIKQSISLKRKGEAPVRGIIVTDSDHIRLEPKARKAIEKSGIPSFVVPEDAGSVEERLLAIFENTKLQIFDSIKAREIRELFKEHFDMGKFIDTFKIRI
jgi:uncharacterized protein